MKSAVYYRVSTRDKQDIGMQVQAVQSYCEREKIDIVMEYQDIGESGSKESRPQFDLLLESMRNREFECIIVYKLDRIGRSISHLLRLFEEFQKKDIQFVSVTQNFNTTTPEGRLFLRMMMLLAEYERELTVSRINSGLDRAKSKGSKLGRPVGRKDGKVRRKSGYHMRWAKSKQSPPK